MKKMFFALLLVVFLVVAVKPIYASEIEWAETSHTWYGDPNPLPLHKNVFKGVLVENVDPTRVAQNTGITFKYEGPWYPHTEDTLELKSLLVYKNGSIVCRFESRDLKKGPVTCITGDLKPGETVDTKVIFKSHKTGGFLLIFYILHDGIVTEGGHIATFVGY